MLLSVIGSSCANRFAAVLIGAAISAPGFAGGASSHKDPVAEKYPGYTFIEETCLKIISTASDFIFSEDVSSSGSSISTGPINYETPQINFQNAALVNGLLNANSVSTAAGDAFRFEGINSIVFVNPVLKDSKRWSLNLTISDEIYQSEWTVGEAVAVLEKHYRLSPTPPKLLDPVRTQSFSLNGNSVRELAVQVARRLYPGQKWIKFSSVDHSVGADGTLQGSGMIAWSMY